MIKYIGIEKIIKDENIVIIDVRSPSEFIQGHIPKAINIPLFSDEERVIVGTLYKKQGKNIAIKKGLEFVGSKLVSFVTEVEKYHNDFPDHQIIIQCFRGGMRSQSFSWLLTTAGINNSVLFGGYKNYRKYIRTVFEKDYNFAMLGGLTGSGKTEILYHLSQLGEQIIDLEGLASHRGSAFGHLGQSSSPSNEQFENELGYLLERSDLSRRVWLEDEAQRIGNCIIPNAIYQKIRNSNLIKIEIPLEQRINRLMIDYGGYDKENLLVSLEKIQKKLGGDRYKKVREMILFGSIEDAVKDVLNYYDKTYEYGISKRDQSKVFSIPLDGQNSQEHAQDLKKKWP